MPRKQRFKPTRKPTPETEPAADDLRRDVAADDPQIAEVLERQRRHDVID